LHFLPFLHIDDRVIVLLPHQKFLAFVRKRRLVGVLDDRFLFAFFEIVVFQRRLLVRQGARARQAAVDQLPGHGRKVSVVTGLGRQHHKAQFEVVEIDLDRLRRFLFLRDFFAVVLLFIFVAFLLLFLVLFGVSLFVFVLLLVLVAFFVVARGEERRHVLAQRHRHKIHRVR